MLLQRAGPVSIPACRMLLALLFLKGIAIGLAVAAPVGPVAVLCIRRTLLQGRLTGLALGLGATLADTIFGAIAGFGVAAVADLLTRHEAWLRAGGGLFMLMLGARTWIASNDDTSAPIRGQLLQAFLSAFVLTITNPITIFAFTGIYAGFGIVGHGVSLVGTAWLTLGVALGAALWWSGLTLTVSLFRGRAGDGNLAWLHHLSGGLLLAFGAAALGSVLII